VSLSITPPAIAQEGRIFKVAPDGFTGAAGAAIVSEAPACLTPRYPPLLGKLAATGSFACAAGAAIDSGAPACLPCR